MNIYPIYTQTDQVREPALVGAWGDTATAFPTWVFSPGDSSEYHVGLQVDSTRIDSTLVGRLTRLRGVLLLDLYAGSMISDSSESACLTYRYAFSMMVPVHVIFRVECSDSELTLWHLSDQWFDKYVERFPRAVHYTRGEGGGPLLTGTTDELRAFLSRHLQDEEMFEQFGRSYVRCASAPVVPAGN